MPLDQQVAERLLLYYAARIKAEAGPGSWTPQTVVEPLCGGRQVLMLKVGHVAGAPEMAADHNNDSTPPSGRGRRSRVPADIMRLLRTEGDKFHSEIMDAMATAGHSRTATNDALKILVGQGFVGHANKDAPYIFVGFEPTDPE